MDHRKHKHVKVDGCGDRLCVINGINADRDVIPAAQLRDTTRFHAFIHKVEAARAARVRLPGDGLVSTEGKRRLRPTMYRSTTWDGKPTKTKAHPFPLKSKFTGRRHTIPAGYRPRRRKGAAA